MFIIDQVLEAINIKHDSLSRTPLLISVPLLTLPALSDMALNALFEQYAFPSICLAPAPVLALWGVMDELWNGAVMNQKVLPSKFLTSFPECAIIIDAGHSCTSVTPLFRGLPVQAAFRQTMVGGRHLTNILKEIVSFRHFDVVEEFLLINDVKEKMCYVHHELASQPSPSPSSSSSSTSTPSTSTSPITPGAISYFGK